MSVSRMVRPRLAANRVSPAHRGAVASAPAVTAAAVTADFAAAAAPAAPEPVEARYGGGHAPAPIRLASAPPENGHTIVVIGTRIRELAERVDFDHRRPESSQLPPTRVPWNRRPSRTLPSSLLTSREGRSAARNLAGSASPEAAAERREHPDPKVWLDHIEKSAGDGPEQGRGPGNEAFSRRLSGLPGTVAHRGAMILQ